MLASRARLVVLLLALPLVAGALSGPASAGAGTPTPTPAVARPGDPPVLVDRSGPFSTWSAVTLETDGAKAVSDLTVSDAALPLQLGAKVYDGDRVISDVSVTYFTEDKGVYARAEPVAGIDVELDRYERGKSSRFPSAAIRVTLNGDLGSSALKGRYTVVMWVSTRRVDEIGGWRWQVLGDPGVQVLGTRTGPHVFLLTAQDLRQGRYSVHAAHRTLDDELYAHARAQVEASATLTIRRTFIGSFTSTGSSFDNLSVSTPQGVRQCVRTCSFNDTRGATAAGPGTYQFHVDGVAGGGSQVAAGDVLVGGANVVLGGADIVLPEV